MTFEVAPGSVSVNRGNGMALFTNQVTVRVPPDAETWTVADEWARLDGIATLVVEIGLVGVVAAATFAIGAESTLQTTLRFAGAAALVASLIAMAALYQRPAAIRQDVSGAPPNYSKKRWLTGLSLGLAIFAIGGGAVAATVVEMLN